MYNRASHDPIFPASTQIPYPRTYSNTYGWGAWQNNRLMPGILGCIDNASIWDPTTDEHWNYLGRDSEGIGFNSRPSGFTMKKIAHWANIWDNTTTIPTEPTKRELVRTLLFRAFWSSNMCSIRLKWTPLNLPQTNGAIPLISGPLGWDVEARHMFQSSLAQLQYNVLETVRGSKNSLKYFNLEEEPGNPPEFSGICSLVKFKSVGWRNVSVWGFSGLLLLSGGISLASCRTEEEKLLLTVGFEKLYSVFRWLCSRLIGLPWGMLWASMMAAKRKCVLWLHRIVRSP